jgi:hypothetical protein
MTGAKIKSVKLSGQLLGIRRIAANGICEAEIIRIVKEQRPVGSAENALVIVESVNSGTKRARYISWIGYYDLEEAQKAEAGIWEVIEPPHKYSSIVEWLPFGWPNMHSIPNH